MLNKNILTLNGLKNVNAMSDFKKSKTLFYPHVNKVCNINCFNFATALIFFVYFKILFIVLLFFFGGGFY